jgi:AAA+ ATPase superfamily predicted ATPase
MSSFVGRQDEIAALTEKNWRDRAVLVALYGRGRVGKTALVEHAFRDCTTWKFEGLEDAPRKTQIALFAKELARYTQSDLPLGIHSWDDAFRQLDKALSAYSAKAVKPVVIFFDEFQWMCDMKPQLVSLFKYHWDNSLSRYPNAVFVICGSISSFIVRKVVQSRALYGRVDIELCLQPLSIRDSRALMREQASPNECIETYMVVGGIPQYLKELNPKLSLVQNLNEYAFKASGYFFREFERLFVSHFAKHPAYERILREVAAAPMSTGEVALRCGIEQGGGLSRRLADLVLAGFLHKAIPLDKGRAARLIRYKLADEYLHFYFAFIAPRSAEIAAGNVAFTRIAPDPQFRQWQGYAFERLCRKHAHVIASHLRFSGINYRAGEWFRRAGSAGAGAQVDLMFVRDDRVLTVCEMKYAERLSVKSLRQGMARRVEVLREAFPHFGIETVLVLGKDCRGRREAEAEFDHVLLAEDAFM